MDYIDGADLAGRRRFKGITQAAVARQLGITREAVGMVESNKITVDDRFAARWDDAIEVVAGEFGSTG